jgi:hypothetical protein
MRPTKAAAVRPTVPEDAPEIISLAMKVFGVDSSAPFIDPALLSWKYWSPRYDFEEPRAWGMERAGRIIAHLGLWPMTIAGNHGVHVIDWMSDPAAPGTGVLLLQQLMRRYDFIYGIGGSAVTRAILPRMGFGMLGDCSTWARPLRPLRQMYDHQDQDWRLPARYLRNLWWSRVPARASGTGVAL